MAIIRIKKLKDFKWMLKVEIVFQEIKRIVTSNLVIRLLYFDKKKRMYIDVFNGVKKVIFK